MPGIAVVVAVAACVGIAVFAAVAEPIDIAGASAVPPFVMD